ncbi:MAG TPA: hypothetical protein VHG90_03965 [Acidimicrobiales bacterium]|nr:hypothetical protein [Acidimicrobiales bacterium]
MSPLRAPHRSLALALVALVAAVGCGSSQFRYVAHDDTQTFLKVPRDWKMYDSDLLVEAEAAAVEAAGEDAPSFVDQAFQGQLQWRVAFDGDPHPEPVNAVSYAEAPVVEVRVRQLTEDERDRVNIASLRNIFFPYDQLKAQLAQERAETPLEPNPPITSSFRPLSEEEIQLEGGIRGSRLRFELRQNDRFYVIDQTALLDGEASRVHVLLMRASEEEFILQRKLLDEIASSFTVKHKKG